MKRYSFEQDIEDNRWYIVLPTWEGDRAELEMVSGADTMLDILAQGRSKVDITMSTEMFEGYTFTLSFLEECCGGGTYLMKSEYHEFEVWLCHVTKFVFGELPIIIFCK